MTGTSDEGHGAAPRARDAGTRERHQRVSARTRAEHDALLVAMHRLEASLATAAPGRERVWTLRVKDDFRAVHDALRRHVHSTDEAGGLLAEILQAQPGLARQVERLREEHARLSEAADRLETAVATEDARPDFAAIRAEAADLLLAVRQHHAREVDATFEAFWTDVGAVD